MGFWKDIARWAASWPILFPRTEQEPIVKGITTHAIVVINDSGVGPCIRVVFSILYKFYCANAIQCALSQA